MKCALDDALLDIFICILEPQYPIILSISFWDCLTDAAILCKATTSCGQIMTVSLAGTPTGMTAISTHHNNPFYR